MHWILPVLLATVPWASDAAPPVRADLIGLGRIAQQVHREGVDGGCVVFTCEDAAQADRLLSKLRADFTWDRLLGPTAFKLPGGQPSLQFDSGNVLVLACRENRVYAVAAASVATVEARLARLELSGPQVRFMPEKRHPLSLDFYDLRSVSMYHLPLNAQNLAKGLQRYERAVLSRSADFWPHFGYSQFGPYFGLEQLVDGPAHFFPLEYCVRLAETRDQVFMTHAGMYQAPWWMRNRFPADIVQWDENAITGWNGLGAMGGTHLSQWASDDAYAYAQRFTASALERLQATAGDRLGCVRVAGGGHPGDEMGMHSMSTEWMDYDEAGQRAFRDWLRESRYLDLAALGRRWYGDPQRFRTWDDVRIPSHFEFFGQFGAGSFDLLKGWQWRPDSPTAEAEGWTRSDYRPGDEWTPTDLAPSMKQLFLFGSESDKQLRQGKSTVAWFRKEFDATAWLAKHPGEQVYLVAQVGDTRQQPVEVFLNDAYLGPIRPKTVRLGPVAFRATALIKPGRNVLCLKVKSGIIRGPVFLTVEQPTRYPYLGATENARWIDLRDWTAAKLITGWKREARLGRQMLPDTPLMFCPGGCLAFSDHFLGLKRELGIASIQFTGGGSNYMPWWAGLGYVWGTYMSSEEGGTATGPDMLSRELAWMLLSGAGHHNYYYSGIDYMQIEQRTGWFSDHRRLLELMGKANWQRPAVAVFRAARSDLYFPYAESGNGGDIGFGSLQAAHYPNVYVTESEIKTGLVSDYPVVFDTGNMVFDDEILAAIERYVRAGGTFVAVHNTGRHALLEPDCWPIARLSGWRVVGTHAGGPVKVTPDDRLLPRLAGRAFNSDEGMKLEAADSQSVVLARWADGATAAGMRRVGRGRIVVLGSPFWQSTGDRTADGKTLARSVRTTFYEDLFASVGATKPADIDSEDVWLRRFTTKNGLLQWVMAYHSGKAPLKDLTLSIPLAQRPRRLLDMVSGKPVEFTWRDGAARVAHLDFQPMKLCVFGVEQPELLEAVEHWFDQKRRYQSRPADPKPAQLLTSPPPDAVVMDQFRFRQLAPNAKPEQAWLDESTDNKPWKPIGEGFWDDLGWNPHGVGLYRQSFQVPESWTGRRVLMGFVSFDSPVFLERAEVFVNGQPAGEYRGHAWANFDVLDVTDRLRPGTNAMAVRVTADQVRGGYLGQLVIFPLEKLDDVRELRCGWRLFSDNRKSTDVSLPLTAVGRHLETRVKLPAHWKPKQMFLEFEVDNRWVGCVVINGRVITFNQSCHPFGNIMQVNLYPWALPGQENCIELWPREPQDTPKVKMVVKGVRIGITSRP